ncbi:helix-turn-helix transcriptional regulator [Pseudoalteromonas piscicida]|uniref:XRE family transcriptional regulator n=2 Tax=Pseudoalteromonas piscicida TaxID=43662 RepID=A0AAD0W4M0_PSEO7|nr:helix-turn-helix transcriptional regulator [Pseudoalteromonas piscicida]ASD66595.1 transcriptional regulator [Pseudoalteromonas piscicida]AXR02692.1 XRE family transcriptional regulator [Pseudoalteromonas piscicida]
MEMQINKQLIKLKRVERAWSQSELAQVSGLSLRTIQRIEKSGAASLESIKALAAVYELNVMEIQHQPKSKGTKLKRKAAAFLAGTAVMAASIFTLTASAKPVMVDLMLTSQGQTLADVQVLNEEGAFSEFVFSDKLKIRLTSTVEQENQVKIVTEIYSLSTEGQVLVASPSVTVQHQKQAEVHFDDYQLVLSPNL